MFCSNCGKSLHPDAQECPHCGANLGEDRFYGNAYTSSQVRIPAEQLNQAPAGGMLTYTRTNYMSYDNQPQNDVYSNTTYRPLLSDEEDMQLQEDQAAAAEEAAAQAEQVNQETAKPAAAEAPAYEEPSEEAQASGETLSFDNLVVEESEIIEEEPAEEEYTQPEPEAEEEPEAEAEDIEDQPVELNWNPDGSINPEELPDDLDELPKPAISPRVRSYMEELDRLEQKRAAGGSGSLRMPSFLQNLRKKPAPVNEELPEAEDIPGQEGEYEVAGENEYAEETEYAEEAEYTEETEYAVEGEYAEETEYVGEDEYAEETEYAGEDEYAEETEYAGEGEYAEEGEFVAEEDGFDAYEDEEYSEEEPKARFSLNIDFKALLQNRILQISVAAVLIVAVLAAGIYWLSYVTTKRSKIVDVTYDSYTKGIELLTANISEEYRSSMKDVYLSNSSYAATAFSEDLAELNALMPETPAANDELFVTTLTIIQDAIAEAIKADANAVLSGAEAEQASASELRWQAIANAVDKLQNATTPGELPVLISDLESVVAPTPTPSPTPAPNLYTTLTNGMNNNLDVRKMQNRLINLGYLSGEPDGDFGNGTENAVKAFQRAAGLTADGVATPEMQEALYADDAPRVSPTAESTAAPSDPSVQ